MAVIAATSQTGSGAREVTVTTLGASDTLVYNQNKSATLVLNNVTAGPLTPLIDGAGSTDVIIKGIGTIDTSVGYLMPSRAAGATFSVPLDTIAEYLKGVVTVTGGDAIEAQILEY